MNMNDFLNLRGLSKDDTVSVNGIRLQDYIKKHISLKNKLEVMYDIEENLMSEVVSLKDKIKTLTKNNKLLSDAASTNAKLIKENEDLKYKLGLSKMFLDNRRLRDTYNKLKENIKVDIIA